MPRWRVMIPIDGFQIYDVDADTPENAFDEILAGNGQVQFEGTIFQNLDDVKKNRSVTSSGIKDSLEKLTDFIRNRGQPVTARDVRRGLYSMRETGAAEYAINRLVANGVLERVPIGASNGRPTQQFRLKENQ